MKRMNGYGVALLACCILLTNVSCSLGSEGIITKEQAINIANNEVLKLLDDLNDWEISFDDKNKIWEEIRNYIRSSPVEGPRFDLEDSMLRGKSFWTVLYLYQPGSGVAFKDGRILVFVDKSTGKVLATWPPFLRSRSPKNNIRE